MNEAVKLCEQAAHEAAPPGWIALSSVDFSTDRSKGLLTKAAGGAPMASRTVCSECMDIMTTGISNPLSTE